MTSKTSILDSIVHPSDLKRLSFEECRDLAGEIRERIVDVVSENGGHLASNLGVVELTISLHRVFESPKDKIIWDVGHQCYAHKLLTGRKDKFNTIRQKNGLSGFPKRSESEHDVFETGHSSTSISAGLGMLAGMDLKGVGGKVVAVIGDGALTGGMAFEALNHAGHLKKDLIIVLNDNAMSISPNVGALSSYLSRLTATKLYQEIRNRIDRGVKRIPLFGERFFDVIVRMKRGIKAFFFKETIFSDLGFEYVGPLDGHNVPLLSAVLKNSRLLGKPVVVHVSTMKGRGYSHAEGDPTFYHGVSPFSVVDGKLERKPPRTFTQAFSQSLMEEAEKDPRIVAITAAMVKGTGLVPFQKEYPQRFFDVGITEQHAVTFAAGLAASGMKPVVALYSTFIQRAVDQVVHDVALSGLPVIFALDRAGLVPGDGETHQGVFDIALFRGIPGLTMLSPASQEEMRVMLEKAFAMNGPVILRYPKASCMLEDPVFAQPMQEGRGVFPRSLEGEVLLMGTGGLMPELLEAAKLLEEDGVSTDLYNLRYLKPLDREYLIKVLSNYEIVFLVEEGVKMGGIGEEIGALCAEEKLPLHFTQLGVEDSFQSQATRVELLESCGLSGEGIRGEVLRVLKSTGIISGITLHAVGS